MSKHIAYGIVDDMEVYAHVTDLNTFLNADPDVQINVFGEDQYSVAKGAVDWYRIQPVDRVVGCDETAHYRGA